MGKVLYNYNVFDVEKSEFVLKNKPLSKVAEITGMPKDKVVQYAESGYIFNEKFHITRRKLDEPEIDIPAESMVIVSPELQAKWDDVIGALNLLKTGGRFVYRNGKPHHVEASR